MVLPLLSFSLHSALFGYQCLLVYSCAAAASTSLTVTSRWSRRQQVCLESPGVGVFSRVSRSGARAPIDHAEEKGEPHFQLLISTTAAPTAAEYVWVWRAGGDRGEPALGIWISKERVRRLTPTHWF